MATLVIKRSKRYKQAAEKATEQLFSVEDAVKHLKQFAPTKFDQTVELIFSLGIDAKQADQAVRSAVSLPHGIGKVKRVIAFCPEHLVTGALNAGALKAGGQELVAEIEKDGFTEFDVAVATPDMMRFVSRLGRVLGPKGLMPSPKAGTVTPEIGTAVREYAAGKTEFRNDSGGNVHTVVGKASFGNDKLVANIQAMIDTIKKLKPQTAKGTYIKRVILKGSMTPAVHVAVA
ncbi:MAG: 50S ribosomal protein L1 [Burkholderiales bacterium]|nr:50S ribosomal protein L1 [Phycisphaerae bacterium]